MVQVPQFANQNAAEASAQAQGGGFRVNFADFEQRFARAIEQFSLRFADVDGIDQGQQANAAELAAASLAHDPIANSKADSMAQHHAMFGVESMTDFDFHHARDNPFAFDYFI